jgi:hypothetical protein
MYTVAVKKNRAYGSGPFDASPMLGCLLPWSLDETVPEGEVLLGSTPTRTPVGSWLNPETHNRASVFLAMKIGPDVHLILMFAP